MRAIAKQQTTPPAELPLSLPEAKDHLRITHALEDDDVTAAIEAATKTVEVLSGRQLIQAVWEIAVDRFPSGRRPQLIPLGRLVSVDQIDYDDTNGDPQTVSAGTIAADYKVRTRSEPGLIYPARGNSWPSAIIDPESVVYTATIGWADRSAVEPNALHAVKLLLGHFFENREAVAPLAMHELPIGARPLIETLIFDDFIDYRPK